VIPVDLKKNIGELPPIINNKYWPMDAKFSAFFIKEQKQLYSLFDFLTILYSY
jgi:hypothetical protein